MLDFIKNTHVSLDWTWNPANWLWGWDIVEDEFYKDRFINVGPLHVAVFIDK